MKTIVTGGAGFIGSHLVKRLLDDNHDVYVFDNFTSGHNANIKQIIPKDHIFESYDYLSNVTSPDLIFHLGIPSSSPMYKQNPFLVSEALNDWINILEFAKSNESSIVWASSSSLYNGNDPPFREDMPVYVTDYYTECRYSMERLAELYYRLHKLSSIGLRLFSVYGPHEMYKGRYANCLTQFFWALRKGESPIIYGDGSQTRDLIYVTDVVKAFMLAATSDNDYDVVNVGTGKAYSFNEIVSLLNQALDRQIKPTYIENPIKNYVWHTQADIHKAELMLNFKAQVQLREGIEKILRSY